MTWLTADTVRGPWASLGIHVDWQRPCIDVHFAWWIITIGRGYEQFDWFNPRDESGSCCPECGALWRPGDHGSMVTSIDNDLLDETFADWPRGGAP